MDLTSGEMVFAVKCVCGWTAFVFRILFTVSVSFINCFVCLGRQCFCVTH